MFDHIKENSVLNDDQLGFTEKYLTVQQLVIVTNTISTNLNRRYLTGMVSLDPSKAFDSVWHEAFPLKLLELNLSKL